MILGFVSRSSMHPLTYFDTTAIHKFDIKTQNDLEIVLSGLNHEIHLLKLARSLTGSDLLSKKCSNLLEAPEIQTLDEIYSLNWSCAWHVKNGDKDNVLPSSKTEASLFTFYIK